jgi:LCP family protein required for cell wall assembly
MLEKIIEKNYGLPIHYYTIIDYAAVRDMVNALGGITVNIKSDDPRGIYDPNFKPEEGGPLKLKNGHNKLNGQQALKLVRARGSTYGSYGFPQSDYNRVENQRKVLTAIKEKIGWRFVLDPRVNSKFFDAAAENVKTDVKVDEVLTLYRLFNRIPQDQLKSFNPKKKDGGFYYTGYTTPLGQSAQIPSTGIDNYGEIQKYVDQLSR